MIDHSQLKKIQCHCLSFHTWPVLQIEPAAEPFAAAAGIVAAVASSFLDRPIQKETIIFGEVGLTGEVRAVGHVETRVAEAIKMGFTRCLVPHSNLKRMTEIKGIELIGIKTVSEAMEELF